MTTQKTSFLLLLGIYKEPKDNKLGTTIKLPIHLEEKTEYQTSKIELSRCVWKKKDLYKIHEATSNYIGVNYNSIFSHVIIVPDKGNNLNLARKKLKEHYENYKQRK